MIEQYLRKLFDDHATRYRDYYYRGVDSAVCRHKFTQVDPKRFRCTNTEVCDQIFKSEGFVNMCDFDRVCVISDSDRIFLYDRATGDYQVNGRFPLQHKYIIEALGTLRTLGFPVREDIESTFKDGEIYLIPNRWINEDSIKQRIEIELDEFLDRHNIFNSRGITPASRAEISGLKTRIHNAIERFLDYQEYERKQRAEAAKKPKCPLCDHPLETNAEGLTYCVGLTCDYRKVVK